MIASPPLAPSPWQAMVHTQVRSVFQYSALPHVRLSAHVEALIPPCKGENKKPGALPLARGGWGGVVQSVKTYTHKLFQTCVYMVAC